MKVIYIGSFYPGERLDEIRSFAKNGAIDYATNSFQFGLIKGIKYFRPNLQLITHPAIRSYPFFYKKISFTNSIFSHDIGSVDYCGGFINIPVLKHLTEYISLKKILKKSININEEITIFIFSIHSSFLKAVSDFKKYHQANVRVCLIVDDLPQFMSESKNPIYLLLKKIDKKIIQYYMDDVDSFVFLSEHMKEYVKVNKRSWVRVEGFFIPPEKSVQVEKTSIKTILYTGTLDRRYGILNLLNAFSSIKSEDYHLWLCGGGNTRKHIEKYAKVDNRITFFGQLPREQITELQRKATILVNPRTSEGEYTKYSFPSKTMEYLASGTPTIMYRLKGIPDEYYSYCYLADEETAEGLKQKILLVCEKEQSELDEFGRRASRFILENKDPISQVKKIFDMLSSTDR